MIVTFASYLVNMATQHIKLLELQLHIREVSKLFCPNMTTIMNKTSTTKREIMVLNNYLRRCYAK